MSRYSPFDLGKCIKFSNSNSSVTWTVPTSMDPANLTQFTAAIWINPSVIYNTSGDRILEPNIGNGGFQMLFDPTSNRGMRFAVLGNGTQGTTDIGLGVIKVGQWQRCLMTWIDGGNYPSVYINGTNIPGSTTSFTGTRQNWSTTTSYIGNNSGSTRAFNGYLDDFCVWNRVLTAKEIDFDASKGIVPTSGLILRFKMDETSGALSDLSPSGISGTASNVTQNQTSFSIPSRTLIG